MKRSERILQKIHNALEIEYANKLFRKQLNELSEYELNILRIYVDEVLHPKWKIAESRDGAKLLVNQTGTSVKDPITGKEYRISYTSRDGKPSYPMFEFIIPTTGKHTIYQVHQLVARAFVPNPENKPYVNHKNGIKPYNLYTNLEWVTASENQQHAIRTGLLVPLRGEEHPNSKCSLKQVEQVCQLLQDHPDWSIGMIANETGVSKYTVYEINRRNSWREISDHYVFPERQVDELKKRIGEDNGFSKYTDEQIIRVCQLLKEHDDWSYKMISDETGVDKYVINDIALGKSRKYISKDYLPFPKRNTKYLHASHGENHPNSIYSNDKIREVCRKLDEYYRGDRYKAMTEIAKECEVNINLVGEIFRGTAHTDIAKDYDFYKAKFG